jgi:hypothetical protein
MIWMLVDESVGVYLKASFFRRTVWCLYWWETDDEVDAPDLRMNIWLSTLPS